MAAIWANPFVNGAHCPVVDTSGTPLVEWASTVSGSCIYGNLSTLSWAMGCISFVSWLGAQLPQVIMNYSHGSVEGLSFGFLANWFVGDATNLLGCLLTNQMAFQTILASYYVGIDCVLCGQYIYYTRKAKLARREKRRRKRELDQRRREAAQSTGLEHSQPIEIVSHLHRSDNTLLGQGDQEPAPGVRAAAGAVASSAKSASGLLPLISSSFLASFSRAHAAPVPGSVALDVLGGGGYTLADLGRFFAWVCTFMYLTSRIPQIVENYQRKSTWGTSLLLFSSALTGNVTYTISILLSPLARGPNSSQFLINELPFLIGSAGTVCFDLTIFFQFIHYAGNDSHEEELDEERAVLLIPEPMEDDGDAYIKPLATPNERPGVFHRTKTQDELHPHPHHQYPDFSLFTAHVAHSVDSELPSISGTPSESTPIMSYKTNYQNIYYGSGNNHEH